MIPEGSPSGTLLRPDQRNNIYLPYIDYHVFIMYQRNIIYLSYIDYQVYIMYQRNIIYLSYIIYVVTMYQRNIIYLSYIDYYVVVIYQRNIVYLSYIDYFYVIVIYQRNCILSAVWKTLSMLKSHMGESKGKMCRSPSQFNTKWRLGENLDKSTFCVDYLIV